MDYKKFIYCAYWGTWNRVLGQDGMWIYELDLTPINPSGVRSWDFTRQEVMRAHGTAFDGKRDMTVDELPAEVVDKLRSQYGEELTHRLINYDYLQEVTLDDIRWANNHSNGGGVPFQAVKDIRDGKRTHWNN